MSWIVMSDGSEVDLHTPCGSSMNMDHIPHHLATINRFTGAACRPYSVAEHSLLVCEIAEREFGLDVHGRLAALMHDAHEAYVNDLSTTAKREVGISWRMFEGRFDRIVRHRFRLLIASGNHEVRIKRADLMALATERAQLLPREYLGVPCRPWAVLDGIEPVTWVDLMSPEREAMTWRDWRDAFKDCYDELTFERGLRIDQQPEATAS